MRLILSVYLLLISFIFTGCGVVETIFKAGMWWAFILMAIVVGVILWVVSKMRRK